MTSNARKISETLVWLMTKIKAGKEVMANVT